MAKGKGRKEEAEEEKALEAARVPGQATTKACAGEVSALLEGDCAADKACATCRPAGGAT